MTHRNINSSDLVSGHLDSGSQECLTFYWRYSVCLITVICVKNTRTQTYTELGVTWLPGLLWYPWQQHKRSHNPMCYYCNCTCVFCCSVGKQLQQRSVQTSPVACTHKKWRLYRHSFYQNITVQLLGSITITKTKKKEIATSSNWRLLSGNIL